MIYTVTMNPSVDFISKLNEIHPGRTNYSQEDSMNAGGRALTVSRMLKAFNVPTTATGFIGGRTGAYIEDELDREGIQHAFIHTASDTRLNISLFVDHIETRILGRGDAVSLEEINDLMYYLSRVREGDYVVIAGSLPPGIGPEIYQRIVEIAVVNGASFLPIIDAEYLQPLIQKKPLLIAPTLKDLSILFDQDVETKEEAAALALQLIEAGAQNVIVNLERDGSLFISSEKKVLEANGPRQAIVSKTYTNMSLIAGFIGNYMRTGDMYSAYRSAQSASNETYYSEGLPSRETILSGCERVDVLPFA